MSTAVRGENGELGRSRLEDAQTLASRTGQEIDLDLPDKGPLEYLLDDLDIIGQAQPEAGQLRPNNWADLKHWADLTGIQLKPFEAEIMIELSKVYVSQYYKSMQRTCPSPMVEASGKPVDDIGEKVRAAFAVFRKSPE